MFKIVVSICYMFFFSFSNSYALDLTGKSGFVDLKAFMKSDYNDLNDIGYVHFVPQYEDVPNPKKAATMEIFFGQIDETKASDKRLKVVANLIKEDQKKFPDLNVEIIAMGPEADTYAKTREFQRNMDSLGFPDKKVHIEKVPKFLDYYSKIKTKDNNSRFPSSEKQIPKKFLSELKENFKNEKFRNKYLGRKFWTAFRFITSTGVPVYALYQYEGISILKGFSISIWAGLASGAISYHSNRFGEFLTNGSWAKWFLESNGRIAKSFRRVFNVNPYNFQESLIRNQEYFRKNFPIMYEANKDLFDQKALEKTKTESNSIEIKNKNKKFQSLLKKIKSADEYLKWYLTEVAFTGTFLKLPQVVGGITAFTGTVPMLNEILYGSFISSLSQGPGDIAIELRKYQQIVELKEKVRQGKIKVENPPALLTEIEKVLASQGEFAKYTIHDGSHYKLISIENRARFKASVFSAFSITGMVLELSGNPLGLYYLGALGVTGGVYLAKVKGLIKASKIKESVKNYVEKVRTGQFSFSLQDWKTRMCSSPYLPAP